jgi:hypothetical protein
LKSLKPILSKEEYGKSEEAVKKFISPDGLGPVLQGRLHEYEKSQEVAFTINLAFERILG